MVVIIKALAHAGLDVYRDTLACSAIVVLGDGSCYRHVLLVNILQQRKVMSAPWHREDADQQSSIANNALHAHICGHSHEQHVRAKVIADKTAHLLFIQLWLSGLDK